MRTDLDGVVAEVVEVAVEVSAVAKPEIAANILRRLILLAAETGKQMMSQRAFQKSRGEPPALDDLPRGLRGLELRREGRVARADARRAVRVAAEERNVRL